MGAFEGGPLHCGPAVARGAAHCRDLLGRRSASGRKRMLSRTSAKGGLRTFMPAPGCRSVEGDKANLWSWDRSRLVSRARVSSGPRVDAGSSGQPSTRLDLYRQNNLVPSS
jgi:hypothetical protein